MNRLAHETSPYLVQHAHNPVDWFPWNEEALEKSRTENKPIFLSIGYSACHWCHVMERECFENDTIADFLNAHFVSIKVDREERPDLDDTYMAAVVAVTGNGGWPMSVFLTPELKPFFGGTYFPPEDRHGMPGFLNVLKHLANLWATEKDPVLESAAGLAAHVAAQKSAQGGEYAGKLDAELFPQAVTAIERSFEPAHGGWSGAPKFPASGLIRFLLRANRRLYSPSARRMAEFTLDRMAEGGMRDQLGGGFHRYSVDAKWLVPHFEKMLYDNAQLSMAYLEAFQCIGKSRYQWVARQILDETIEEMRAPGGGFFSSLDADSPGGEGMYYVWTKEEIDTALGAEDARLFCEVYGVRADGNFTSHEPYHVRHNVLHLARPWPEAAAREGLSEEELEARLKPMRQVLKKIRAHRARPSTDDKIITSWNGLMISSFARAAQILDEPAYAQAATEAARSLRARMESAGGLMRCYRGDTARVPGFLDDYMALANAFVDIYECTFDMEWLDAAIQLAEEAIRLFWNEDEGLFYLAAVSHGNPVVRAMPRFDNAEPSGNSMATLLLPRLAQFTGKADFEDKARRILEGHAGMMGKVPQALPVMLCAADFIIGPVTRITVVGEAVAGDTRALLHSAHAPFVPNRVVVLKEADGRNRVPAAFQDPQAKVDGKATAYVCVGEQCGLPVTDPESLLAQLKD